MDRMIHWEDEKHKEAKFEADVVVSWGVIGPHLGAGPTGWSWLPCGALLHMLAVWMGGKRSSAGARELGSALSAYSPHPGSTPLWERWTRSDIHSHTAPQELQYTQLTLQVLFNIILDKWGTAHGRSCSGKATRFHHELQPAAALNFHSCIFVVIGWLGSLRWKVSTVWAPQPQKNCN